MSVPRPNESDLFYVVSDVDEPPAPPQRAVQNDDSLEHARLRLQFSAVVDGRDPSSIGPQGTGWAERRRRQSSGAEMLEVLFGRDGTVHIPVSRTLKGLEQAILASPTGPVAWRTVVRMGQPDNPTVAEARWPSMDECRKFLEARTVWFDAVRGGTAELITQAADLRELRPLAVDYADAYQRLHQRAAEASRGKRQCGGQGRALRPLANAYARHRHRDDYRPSWAASRSCARGAHTSAPRAVVCYMGRDRCAVACDRATRAQRVRRCGTRRSAATTRSSRLPTRLGDSGRAVRQRPTR